MISLDGWDSMVERGRGNQLQSVAVNKPGHEEGRSYFKIALPTSGRPDVKLVCHCLGRPFLRFLEEFYHNNTMASITQVINSALQCIFFYCNRRRSIT